MKQKSNNNPRECPICGKPFPSGKAMGGHMRAHYVTHAFPPPTMIIKNALKNLVESIHSQVGENLMLNSSVKIESSSQWKSLTRARSRCRRRFMAAEAKVEAEAKEGEEAQQESSMPDADAQHAAETLIGMSMGSIELTRVSAELVEKEEDNIQLNDEFDNEEEVGVQAPDKPLDMKLKIKVENYDYEDDDHRSAGGDGDEKRHQCPVCLKMLASGQGLGGHMRVHMANVGAGKGDEPSTSGDGKSDKTFAAKLRPCFDLNLPPPETDEEVTFVEDLSNSSNDEELFG